MILAGRGRWKVFAILRLLYYLTLNDFEQVLAILRLREKDGKWEEKKVTKKSDLYYPEITFLINVFA